MKGSRTWYFGWDKPTWPRSTAARWSIESAVTHGADERGEDMRARKRGVQSWIP
jgi:hypothetical protein